MGVSEILEELYAEFKTDKEGLAKILEVHKTTIGHLHSGHTKKFSTNLAQKIVNVRPDINFDWILGKSDIIKVPLNKGPYLQTYGKKTISIDEISEHFLNNVEEFEKSPVFALYRKAIFNEGRASAFEEQIKLNNGKGTIDLRGT